MEILSSTTGIICCWLAAKLAMFLRVFDKSDSVTSPNNQETASPTVGINALFWRQASPRKYVHAFRLKILLLSATLEKYSCTPFYLDPGIYL